MRSLTTTGLLRSLPSPSEILGEDPGGVEVEGFKRIHPPHLGLSEYFWPKVAEVDFKQARDIY